MVAHDPGAAEDLHGLRRHAHRDVGRKRLRVGAEQTRVLSGDECCAGAPDEQACRLDLHRHVRQLESDALPAEDRTAERLALPRVLGGVLECRARDPDGTGCDLWARGLEEVQRDRESLPSLAEKAVGSDLRIVEDQGSGVGGAQPELAFLAAGLHAGIVSLDEKRCDLAVELGKDDGEVGDAPVGDVDLLPGQHVGVTVPTSLGADRREVGAGMRLRERDRREGAFLARE